MTTGTPLKPRRTTGKHHEATAHSSTRRCRRHEPKFILAAAHTASNAPAEHTKENKGPTEQSGQTNTAQPTGESTTLKGRPTASRAVQPRSPKQQESQQPETKTIKPSDLGEAVVKKEDAHQGEDAEAQPERGTSEASPSQGRHHAAAAKTMRKRRRNTTMTQ